VSRQRAWTVEELRGEIERYERELLAAGMKQATIQSYTDRARRFTAWLEGDYKPGPGRVKAPG
jgi:hypothetical protein